MLVELVGRTRLLHQARVQLMVPILLAATAWCGPPSSALVAPRARVPASIVASAIEATPSCAEAQRAEFFALMPSEELPKYSLDVRLFASKKDDNFQAKIFARQDGTVPTWKDVGTIAVCDEAQFGAAVAKQRALIAEWARQVCNDFETNELVINPDEPVELAWAVKPPPAPFWEKQPPIKLERVAVDAGFEPDLRCGFLGKTAREYRGGGVSPRYERIVLGQPPAVPLPRSEAWGSSGGPYGVKARQKARDEKGQGPKRVPQEFN